MRGDLFVAAGLAAALTMTAGAAMGQSPDKDSQSFIKTAIEGNIAEIDIGKLAREKGKNPAVKQYGAMLVKDHGAANAKAKSAAKTVNVTPPTGSSMGAKAAYLKLKVLSGDAFDKSFAASMVSDHEGDIKEYQHEAQKSDAVGKYAKESLPTLQKHLQEAQQLQKKVQQTTGSK
jgi:putative membrane protein